MFDKPPKCWLHKQGNFVTSFFPTDLVAGKDYDFFYLPPIDPALGMPFEVAGDIYAIVQGPTGSTCSQSNTSPWPSR